MNRELEVLLQAYEAVLESRGAADHARSQTVFDSLLEDFLGRHPRIAKETVQRVIREAHRQGIFAQRKPPTLPPTA
jgi:hypothetical protein